jgi:hypothetical protein
LFDNQVNCIGLSPFLQHRFFIQEKIDWGSAEWSGFLEVLINKKELPIQIKHEAAAVVERSFENRIAACDEMWI